MALNIDSPVPTAEEAARHRYSAGGAPLRDGPARPRGDRRPGRNAARELEEMAERYGADEVMVLTITGDYASRLRSYELLIEAMN